MLLDAPAHSLQILPQPVVAEVDARIRIGLGLGGANPGIESLKLMTETDEHFALSTRIS